MEGRDMDTMLLVVGLIVLALLGLFVAGTGARLLRRGGGPARGTFFVVFGLLALGLAGGLGWMNWPLIVQLFQPDEDDPEAQERLGPKTLGGDAPDASKDEWPQWRGYRRDGISGETGLLTAWPRGGPRRLWRTRVGGGFSSPSVAGGRVYVTDKKGDEERVLCLDAENGKEVWAYRYAVDYAGLAREYARGPRATPTVHDGRVYTVGATGVFLCLEAPKDGNPKLLWRHDLLGMFDAKLPEWGVASSPLVEGDLVIVQPGGSRGSIAAFDRVTGTLKWTALKDASGYSSPVAATAAGERQIVCFTARKMVGLRPGDGTLLWEYAWSTRYNANIATPVVDDNYVFLSSDYNAGCALLELQPGTQGGVRVRPVFVRRNKLMRNHFSTCILRNSHLYGYDNDTLTCVDVKARAVKWSERGLEKGCVLYADGHLLVLTQGGLLVLAEATPDGYNKKAEAEVLDSGPCWALPALAGGRLYLRDNEHVVCLDLKR